MPDPIYLSDVANANRQHDTDISGLYGQRTLTAQQYGYNPTYNDQGLIASLAVDPNNPYSKAALLRQSYERTKRSNFGSLASAGQLYSGAITQRGELDDSIYSQNSDALQKAFINFIATNQSQITQANTNWVNALSTAAGSDAYRASQSDTGDSGGAGGTPGVVGYTTGSSGVPSGGVSSVFQQAAQSQLGPKSYSGPTGLVGGQYIDSNGGAHAVQTKNGKRYYLNSNGGWTPF